MRFAYQSGQAVALRITPLAAAAALAIAALVALSVMRGL